jgi:hypothetical protein
MVLYFQRHHNYKATNYNDALDIILHIYRHTYYSRFIPEEVSQIFLQDTHVLPKLVICEEHCRRDRW